jgi:ribulose-5-phosphate 4-epimerase/fuculose-1-phosphate aldolase
MILPHLVYVLTLPSKDDDTRARYQKGQLALAARIMEAQGWGIGCAVGLSARDALDKNTVWVLPKGKPLIAMTSADLVAVSLDGEVVGEGKCE